MAANVMPSGFWLLFMGVLTFVFLICSLRTNVVFVTIFFSLMFCFFMLTAGFWALAADAAGNAVLANRLIVVRTTPFFSIVYTCELT